MILYQLCCTLFPNELHSLRLLLICWNIRSSTILCTKYTILFPSASLLPIPRHSHPSRTNKPIQKIKSKTTWNSWHIFENPPTRMISWIVVYMPSNWNSFWRWGWIGLPICVGLGSILFVVVWKMVMLGRGIYYFEWAWWFNDVWLCKHHWSTTCENKKCAHHHKITITQTTHLNHSGQSNPKHQQHIQQQYP